MQIFTGVISAAASDGNHRLQIELHNDSVHAAELTGNKAAGQLYQIVIEPSSFVPALPECITPGDIKQVSIVTNSNDGWFISSSEVSTATGGKALKKLTLDPAVYKWVDSNEEQYYFETYGSASYATEVLLALQLQ